MNENILLNLEFYTKSSKQCIIDSDYLGAADAYIEAADIHFALRNTYASATNQVNAANIYILIHEYSLAKASFNRAIYLFLKDGKFATAAKTYELVASLELEAGSIREAIFAFEQANKYYRCENSPATGTQCLLSAADCSAEIGEYEKALKYYEECYAFYIESDLLRSKCKRIFFNSTILYIQQRPIGECREFIKKSNTLLLETEVLILNQILDAIEYLNFEDVCKIAKECKPFEITNWQIKILKAKYTNV